MARAQVRGGCAELAMHARAETAPGESRTISSVQGLGYSPEISIPRSAIASIAAGLMLAPGSDPPDHATAQFEVVDPTANEAYVFNR